MYHCLYYTLTSCVHTFHVQDQAGERNTSDEAFHLGCPGQDRLPSLCPQSHLVSWFYISHHLKAHGLGQLQKTHTEYMIRPAQMT